MEPCPMCGSNEIRCSFENKAMTIRCVDCKTEYTLHGKKQECVDMWQKRTIKQTTQ